MSNVIESITSSKEITIIHPYSQSEIKSPTFGGTRLIAEQIGYLEELGSKVRVISLGEIGSLTSFLYRLQANLRGRESDKARNPQEKYDSHSEKSRWWLNLVQVLINEYSAKFDILYRYSIKKMIESVDNGSILIYHYPYGSRYFAPAAKKKDVQFILYQHNIEWKFFDERLGDGWIRRMLISKARKIELDSLGSADVVAFASDKDRSSLATENGFKTMISWIPIRKRPEKGTITEIPASIRDKIKGKLVVGFVGTNFGPNIAAVENLVELARETSGSLVFLVMGSVSRSFQHRNDIPHNVVFSGYVEELDSYLSHCDLFINPKTTSDTGVETKMFDYMKFDKYIISTESGASGFDSNEKVIISPIEEMLTRDQLSSCSRRKQFLKSIEKVTIAGNYALRNRGDELLLRGTMTLLRKILGSSPHFNLFVSDPELDKEMFHDEESSNITFLSHPLESEKAKDVGSKISALARFSCLFLWSCIYRTHPSPGLLKLLSKADKRKVSAVLGSDLIIYRSIDQLSSIFGPFNFLKLFFQVLFFYNLKGARLVLHAQTVYVEGSSSLARIMRYLIKYLTSRVKLTVRDMYSLRWLDGHGIRHHGIIPPPSIAVTEELVKHRSASSDLSKLIIIPRASIRGHRIQGGYERLTTRLLSQHEDLEIYLMGQSSVPEFQDDDYREINAIVNALDEKTKRRVHVVQINDKSLTEILDVIADASCVISERAFSIVSALSMRVPVITLDPYGGKNIGLAELFEFEKYSMSSADMDVDRIAGYFNDIISNRGKIISELDLRVQKLAKQLEDGTETLILGLENQPPRTHDRLESREALLVEHNKVSIIMVNYNGATFLREGLTEAIHSFLKTDYPNCEFIFVDNGSNDDSIEEARKVFSQYPIAQTVVVKNNDNLGFAGGCEEGIKVATGEYVCLVNNDDKAIDTDWLNHLIRVIQSDDRIGVAFCKKMKWDNPSEIDARGLTMNPAGLMQNTKLEDEQSDCLVWQTPVLIKREIISKIGGLFDEDYVVLNDDTDSSLRIWLAGYRIVYVPSAVVLHKRSATMKMLPVEFITFHGRKNTIQTVIKNYGLKNLIRWLPVTAGIYLTLYFYYLKIGRKDHARGTLRALTWNVRNFGRLMKKRRSIQRNVRKIDDSSVFSMMNRFNMIEVMKGDKVWPK